jgi:energy-coupling factor transporter transmembrane protein EcfT
MAGLRGALFRFTGVPTRPRRFGLRLGLYAALGLGAWLFPPWGALAALATVGCLGRRLPWGAWLRGLGWLWVFVLAPLAVALPTLHRDPAQLAPPAGRSLTFLALLAASQWLSATSTVPEIRTALERLFRPLGRGPAGSLGLAGALALGFIPWMVEQVEATREAAALRGIPARRPLLALRALAVPVLGRMIQKARHTADALELRGR